MKTPIVISLFLVGIMLFSGCEYFGYNKPSSDAMAKEALKSIDWNQVDEYPSFPECDSLEIRAAKLCFEITLARQLYSALQDHGISVKQSLNDTVFVELLIQKTGDIEFVSAEKNNAVMSQIPMFDSILEKRIASLPQAYPASKRGVPVATKFKLPIVLKSE